MIFNAPLVTIVIPTFNSERTLAKCLESVKNQTHKNIEVIIVDNCSKDKTIKIAREYGARVVQVSASRAEARNIGAKEAKGEFILSVDSDMELSATVVEKCLTTARKNHDAIIIPEISVGEGFWARCKSLESKCYIKDDLIEAARFLRNDVFKAVGGYDPELVFGEDWDLHLRIEKARYKIGRVGALIKHQEGRVNLWESIKKKYEYGKTLRKYKQKHPREFNKQAMLIRPAFVKNWKILTKDPFHTLGMISVKIFEFGAVGMGYMRSKVQVKR